MDILMSLDWSIWVALIGVVILFGGLLLDDVLSLVLPDGLFPSLGIAVLFFGATVWSIKDVINLSVGDSIMYAISTVIAIIAAVATFLLLKKMNHAVESVFKESVNDLLGKEASIIWWSEKDGKGIGEVLISGNSNGKITATGSVDLEKTDSVRVTQVFDMKNVEISKIEA